MLAITIDGYALSAIAIVCVVVVILARIVARLMHDHGVRIARVGVFIERKRVGESSEERKERIDNWTPDPLSDPRDQETRPLPIPPPTPPPPLPEHGWPQREEET